jgi:hypothetical protein
VDEAWNRHRSDWKRPRPFYYVRDNVEVTRLFREGNTPSKEVASVESWDRVVLQCGTRRRAHSQSGGVRSQAKGPGSAKWRLVKDQPQQTYVRCNLKRSRRNLFKTRENDSWTRTEHFFSSLLLTKHSFNLNMKFFVAALVMAATALAQTINVSCSEVVGNAL